jgi:Ras-related GTP-binding protein A/B
MEALWQHSPDARVFVLVHKMDTVAEVQREEVFRGRAALVRGRSRGFDVTPLATSIWDETLYRAWSAVVTALIPHVRALEAALEALAEGAGADEVVLFERASFLVICQVTRRPHPDVHRLEKVSNVVKQFKLACSRGAAQFGGLRTGNSAFTVLIESFTPNTYLMLVSSASASSAAAAAGGAAASDRGCRGTSEEATLLAVALARPRFDQLIAEI